MARFITFGDKWGIIGINGEVLLPPVYDRIWPFEGKDFDSARTEKNGVTIDFDFAGLRAGKYSNDYYYALNEAISLEDLKVIDSSPFSQITLQTYEDDRTWTLKQWLERYGN